MNIAPFTTSEILSKTRSVGKSANNSLACITLPICYKQTMDVPLSDICHLEGHSNYTLFYFNSGKKLLVSKTMKEFTSDLDEQFVRIHKKFVINLSHIIHFDIKEDMFVLLKNGKKLSISRRRKKEFLNKSREVLGKFFN